MNSLLVVLVVGLLLAVQQQCGPEWESKCQDSEQCDLESKCHDYDLGRWRYVVSAGHDADNGPCLFIGYVPCVGNSTVLCCCSDVQFIVNMSKAVKTRTAARGWLTRSSKRLETLCGAKVKELDKATLIDAIEEFDKKLNALDEAQSSVELESEETVLEADIEQAADFRDEARVPRVQAARLLAALVNEEDDKRSSCGGTSTKVDVKLPKLELPDFSGDPLEWQSFWDQFTAVIHESDMPDVNKFTYLRSLLKGEAKAAIQGLSLTSAHYNDACYLLQQRFGRKERLIFAHIQDLLILNVPKQSKVSLLCKLQDDLQAHDEAWRLWRLRVNNSGSSSPR